MNMIEASIFRVVTLMALLPVCAPPAFADEDGFIRYPRERVAAESNQALSNHNDTAENRHYVRYPRISDERKLIVASKTTGTQARKADGAVNCIAVTQSQPVVISTAPEAWARN